MSFGDGNLRERVGDLNRQVDKLQRVNGELCAEINRQERRIRELEGRTCRMEYQTGSDNPMRGWWLCDKCGGLSDSVGGGWDGKKQRMRPPAYCARCGAKVVDE